MLKGNKNTNHQIFFFSRSLEQFFLTVGQNNFGNKIPNVPFYLQVLESEKLKLKIRNVVKTNYQITKLKKPQ